jgi:hypothetical protein
MLRQDIASAMYHNPKLERIVITSSTTPIKTEFLKEQASELVVRVDGEYAKLVDEEAKQMGHLFNFRWYTSCVDRDYKTYSRPKDQAVDTGSFLSPSPSVEAPRLNITIYRDGCCICIRRE